MLTIGTTTPRYSRPHRSSDPHWAAIKAATKISSDNSILAGTSTPSSADSPAQLLYRVPIFDPFLAELCASTATSKDEAAAAENTSASGSESKLLLANNYGHDGENLHGCLPSDMDLAEFAADVESLLGMGFENESFGMEGLGLMDCKLEEEGSFGSRRVKLEEEEGMEAVTAACRVDDTEIDMMREPFELNFDYDSPATCEEEDEKVGAKQNGGGLSLAADDAKKKKKKKILLNLDYEAVITAWASQGSPWASGDRPNFDPDECWPDCLGSGVYHPYGEYGGSGRNPAMGDGGREARVSRYREKRRTRLFSKKIRYEVRKLNAEKRPRMKGRFVKRSSFAGPAFPLLTTK